MHPLMSYPDIHPRGKISESMGYEMTTMHLHDDYEIYMALCENVRFFVGNQVYALEKGDVVLFSSNDLHKVSVPGSQLYRRCVITFPPQILIQQIASGQQLLECYSPTHSRHLQLTKQEQEHFLKLVEQMQGEDESRAFSYVAQWLYLCELLLLLCRVSRRLNSAVFPEKKVNSACVRQIMAYIDEHYMEDISLDTLASLCFLNKSYLCRIFKHETGFRMHDYLLYRRISSALPLLRQGESVRQTAILSGFRSDTFFIRAFRECFSMTPYQYTKEHQRKQE